MKGQPSRTHSSSHARPDEKMGNHHRWHKGSRLIGPWAGAWKRTEKRMASRKRRKRDQQVIDE